MSLPDDGGGLAEQGTDPASLSTPPGPDGLPLLGNARSLVADPEAFYEEMSTYGDVVAYSLAGMEFTTVLHPALIQQVLLEGGDAFEKWGFEDLGGEFAPEGLPTPRPRSSRRSPTPSTSGAAWTGSRRSSRCGSRRRRTAGTSARSPRCGASSRG